MRLCVRLAWFLHRVLSCLATDAAFTLSPIKDGLQQKREESDGGLAQAPPFGAGLLECCFEGSHRALTSDFGLSGFLTHSCDCL